MKILIPPPAAPSGCRVYLADNYQQIPHNAWTKVQLNAKDYDHNNEFDSETNYRYTAKEAGYYLCIGCIEYSSPVASKNLRAYIKKNGENSVYGEIHTVNIYSASVMACSELHLDVDDYLELFTMHNCGVTEAICYGSDATFLNIRQLRRG